MPSSKDSKLKKAAALRHAAQKDPAPRVAVKGRGKAAERIVALVRDYQVPMVEDANLAQLLESLDPS